MSIPTPMLRLTASMLPALHRALADGRDPAEAARLARRLGFESGAAFHEALSAWALQEGGGELSTLPPEEFWDAVAAFFSHLGWGELRHEGLHDGLSSLTAASWAEARTGVGARYPTCHVTTGLLAEVLSRVAGTDLAVMEVECRSRGDEGCRFLVGGHEALVAVHQATAEGGSLEQALARL